MKIYSAANLVDSQPDCTGSEPHGESAHEFSVHELSVHEFEVQPPFSRPTRGKKESARGRDARPRVTETESEGGDIFETRVCETEVEFCSRSEAICAELLRQFVPHFTLQLGVTFQVAIGSDCHGNTLAVDFLVDGVLFEYHPVRLFKNRRRCGDFNSKREYRAYTDICHSLGVEQREFFQTAMRARLTDNYYHKRRALLDQHPVFRRMELIVATTPEEFYYLVLRRFGKNIPRTIERFLDIFEGLKESLPA